jgi:hypothetical protein
MNSDKLMALLDKQGFTVIENCFANYNYTLASISSIFLMKHHYYLAEVGDRSITRGMLFGVMAGENPVICTLKANGYAINYIDFKGGIFIFFQRGPNIDLFLAHINRSHLCLLYSLRFNLFNAKMLFVIRELFHLEAEAEDDDIPQYRVTSAQPGVVELLSQKKESPTCTIVYMGADHTGYRTMLLHLVKDKDVYARFIHEDYPDLRRCADDDLAAMLELIQKHDPEALIILIGDHAAHSYDWAYLSSNPVEEIHSYGIEPSLVGRDHVSVLCAIRWPLDVTHYSADRVISHVNLFRHVFAALAEDPAVLAQGYQADESYVPIVSARGVHDNTRLYCVARDGKLLDDWEVFTPPPLE